MSRQPLFIMLLAFCFGIVLRDSFNLWYILAVLLLVVVCLVFCLSFVCKIDFLVKLRPYLLFSQFLCFGFIIHHFTITDFKTVNIKGEKSVVFTVSKKLNSSEDYRKYQVEVLNAEQADRLSKFDAVLQVPKELPALDFLHYYKTKVYFTEIKMIQHDFQFNYNQYLARQNIAALGFANNDIQSAEKLQVSYSERIRQMRLDILHRINSSKLQPKNQEFLKGIILADRTEMDGVVVSDFNKSGLVHILAISGSHMLIVFWVILFLLNKMTSVKYRKISLVVALLGIWAFAIFIDYGNSVVRSCIMISIYYISFLLNRKPHLLQSVAVSAFIILVWNTQQLYDVGFQLSYIAVLGIFWLYQPIVKLFPEKNNKVYRFLVAVFSLSLAAQIGTLPLVLYYFHQYSLISIIANLCVIPFSEIIIIFSLIMVVLFAINLELLWLDNIYDYFVDLMLQIIHWFAGKDVLMFKNVGFSLIELIFAFIIIYFLRFILVRKNLKSVLSFSFSVILFSLVKIAVEFHYFNKDEVAEVISYKSKVVFIKEHADVMVFVKSKNDNEKLDKYIINPYIISRRITRTKIIRLNDDVQGYVYKGQFHKW